MKGLKALQRQDEEAKKVSQRQDVEENVSILPDMQKVKSRLREIFICQINDQQCNRVQAISNLKSNQHAKDCISLLAIRNEADVLVSYNNGYNNFTYRIF